MSKARRGRGGRRAGAGAPRGNRNALRSGKHVADPELRRALRRAKQALPSEDYEALIRELKSGAGGSIKPILIEDNPSNVLPLRRLSISSSAPLADQSTPYRDVILRLRDYGFRGAGDFVRRHHRYTPFIEDAIGHLDDLDERRYGQVTNPPGLISADVHKEIGVPRGKLVVCPAAGCTWSEAIVDVEELES